MKKQEQTMEAYEAPRVKVIEVEVEQGFAVSTDARTLDYFEDGGDL